MSQVKEDQKEAHKDRIQWFDPLDIKIYENPRTITNPGFGPEKMKELREDIRRKGLKQNLEVRKVEGEVLLIAGERRLRSITNLRETEAECFNPDTGKMAPASVVYGLVPCVVTECANDKEAMRAAVMENLLHEHLTDYELLLQLDALEKSGHSRQEQAEMFNKSEAWVSQSHSLITGNKKVLEALADGTLGRTQALQFIGVEDEKVEAVLTRSIAYSRLDFEAKEKELIDTRNGIYERLDQKEEELSKAEEAGDVKRVGELRGEIASETAEVEAHERRIKKHRSTGKRKPRPSINNIQQGMKDEEADGGVSRHMPMKTVRRIADQLTELLSSGKKLENTDTKVEYSRREVRILRDALDCILSRNKLKNPLEALDVTDDGTPETATEPPAEQPDTTAAAA